MASNDSQHKIEVRPIPQVYPQFKSVNQCDISCKTLWFMQIVSWITILFEKWSQATQYSVCGESLLQWEDGQSTTTASYT